MTDGNDPPAGSIAPTALAALVFANAPALQKLSVCSSRLGDAGLGALADALAHNTHLRELGCFNTGMSARFARDRLVPAVRANTSLRKLNASEQWADGAAPAELLEAEQLVAARGAA